MEIKQSTISGVTLSFGDFLGDIGLEDLTPPAPTPKQITSLVHEVRRSADISVSLHQQLAAATARLNNAKTEVANLKKKLKAHEAETLKMIVDCGGGKQSLPFDDLPVAHQAAR